MKKLIRSTFIAAFCAVTLLTAKVQAATDAPYIDNVILGDEFGSYITTNGVPYNFYEITIVLDWPRPETDYMDWYAIHNSTSWTFEYDLVSWPDPATDWALLDEWWNVYEHILVVRAIKRSADEPNENETIDNAYKFWREESEDYSMVCHGCAQGNGGVYIYNP